MENKTMSTNEAKDFTLTQNTAYEPVVKTDTSTEEAMYSDLQDYSDYQLPKANVKDTKPPQQPVQYTVGKKSFAAIIILLVIIIFLLVAILVLNLISKDTFMSTCTSNASSNSAGLTNSGNTAINCNLSLMQKNVEDIKENCATKNSLLLLQSNVEDMKEQINEHNVNSNLSLTQSTMNQILLILNAIDNISLALQNKIDHLMAQVNEHNVNSNLSLIQDTMNSIIQQIMVHANNTNRSTDELLQLLNTSLIKDISIPTAAAVNNVLLIVNELLEIQNGSSTQTVSCKNIKTAYPNSPSGYYHFNSRNIYCNMGELCGQDGGWTRIAYLDITMNCPSGLQELMTGGIRLCRREGDSAGCRSNVFQTNGISYSQICGKVVGYQKGSTDAVHTSVNNINGVYVDGVSITRGSPRQHVWSYIAGLSSEHYYCEAGSVNFPSQVVYTDDPLWDGKSCFSNEAPCCTGTGLPWFFRDYGNATITDYIELRVCGHEGHNSDDTPVQLYEIYIK
ncbi:PREDICTED: uncharacterized protein LOC109582467 [Amphimedon queenslandica]|uniref:Fibrinogen C-terminal domain-containing protein n=1 Tax=Amphimedon queenslandica TaxID=400682 RepID=A0AAN0J6U3_AMPQE|nr:PREDICTED: uncharacterized protein LOC109582467 [Amphimedon queenslandica]|eukprot:XP_019852744.1 PREDICTED: uncharacterized protein LOC109582467 [Amphimedon queenslandica]